MNQINPSNADVAVNVPPQVILQAADQGTLQNVKSVEQKGDSLVVVTNDGHKVTVTGEEPIVLLTPNKKAQTDLMQLSKTLNEVLDPKTDAQAQFNMAMVLNILFELEENQSKSTNLAVMSDLYAGLAETKASARDLKNAAIVGLAFGVTAGAVQMGAGAYGVTGEAKSLAEAGQGKVIREVPADAVKPEKELGEVNLGKIDGLGDDDVVLKEVKIDDAEIGKKADPAKTYPREIRMDDQEFQIKYNSASRTRMAKGEIIKAIGSVIGSTGQGTSGIVQSAAKKHDALAQMYNAMQGMENQNMQKAFQLMTAVIGLIQSAGDSQNQTLGAIGQGMA